MKYHLCPPELKLTTTLFVLAICFCGCSSSYTVSSTGKPNAEYSYGEMNEELTGRDVIIKNHLVGAGEGLGIGILVGGGIGLFLGSLYPETGSEMATTGLLIGGGAGGVLGLIPGLIIGHSYEYEYSTSEQSDSLQNRK